jgi:hypothetical protein
MVCREYNSSMRILHYCHTPLEGLNEFHDKFVYIAKHAYGSGVC